VELRATNELRGSSAGGQPADFAIGQPDLTTNETGHEASQLANPTDVTTAGDHLFVVDTGNNRVLVFSPIPTSSGASASLVLGQPNFDTISTGTTQETFTFPYGLAVGGNKLYVADTGNSRILRFDLKL
jgi:DNA-binding beta-propeller fold protein YncE